MEIDFGVGVDLMERKTMKHEEVVRFGQKFEIKIKFEKIPGVNFTNPLA